MSDRAASVVIEPSVWERMLPPAVFLVVALIGWEGAVQSLGIPKWLLPAPSAILARFLKTPSLWQHTLLTVMEATSGFVASAVLGISLAAGISHSRFLERGVFPYVVISNAIPIIAIIPLLTIWFGFGYAPKIMIAAIISFFPIVTNTTRGFKSADQRVLDFMRSINATRWQVFTKIQFPTALPFMFAAFRIASSLSIVGAVVAEFYGSDRGLGYLVITSATQLQTDLLFVSIAVLASLGVGCFSLFGRVERAYSGWQAEQGYQR
jgi:ABC-type nitrate/sulfonate/bicarbonate transport system permease component